MNRAELKKYAWMSIAAAVVTIILKTTAYLITGSVGLLSDAIESLVNLAAALFALFILIVAARPPDEEHPYGHGKAEYFAGGVEGSLIFIASIGIAWTAVERLIHPQPLERMNMGLILCVAASLVNLVVAIVLLKAGRKNRSMTLEADAKHLLTDVWTSGAVIVGVGAVAVTGWQSLDPIVALLAAANILWSGYGLVKRAVSGLMDSALPTDEMTRIDALFSVYKARGIRFHALRATQAGARRMISVHVLTPGDWSIRRSHDLAEEVEHDLRGLFPEVTVMTHLEPIDDPVSWQDVGLDR